MHGSIVFYCKGKVSYLLSWYYFPHTDSNRDNNSIQWPKKAELTTPPCCGWVFGWFSCCREAWHWPTLRQCCCCVLAESCWSILCKERLECRFDVLQLGKKDKENQQNFQLQSAYQPSNMWEKTSAKIQIIDAYRWLIVCPAMLACFVCRYISFLHSRPMHLVCQKKQKIT